LDLATPDGKERKSLSRGREGNRRENGLWVRRFAEFIPFRMLALAHSPAPETGKCSSMIELRSFEAASNLEI
jgi:hypothetical protein